MGIISKKIFFSFEFSFHDETVRIFLHKHNNHQNDYFHQSIITPVIILSIYPLSSRYHHSLPSLLSRLLILVFIDGFFSLSLFHHKRKQIYISLNNQHSKLKSTITRCVNTFETLNTTSTSQHLNITINTNIIYLKGEGFTQQLNPLNIHIVNS